MVDLELTESDFDLTNCGVRSVNKQKKVRLYPINKG